MATSGCGSSADRTATRAQTKRATRSASDVTPASCSAARGCCWSSPSRLPEVLGIARRTHTWLAAQRIDAEPRIVGDRGTAPCCAAWRALASAFSMKVSAAPRPRQCRARPAAPDRVPAAGTAPEVRRASWRCWTPGRASRLHRFTTRVLAFCAATRSRMPRSARQQAVHLGARERCALGGALHFDEAARAGHHHVHVGVAGRVLDVFEVEQRHALHDPDRHRRDGRGSGWRRACFARSTRSRRRAPPRRLR
jgi:hypothetical protein